MATDDKTAASKPPDTLSEALAARSQGEQKKGIRQTREKRPNYNEIHAKPLPLDIHPLPAFIPHNPLSIVRIALAYLSHSIWPPTSHASLHQAYFSPETQSVHVIDPASIRALWEQGFFGTGSLSRSEPRWLDQEKRKRGLEAAATSEEYTRARREERQRFKLERAKAQRDAIEQQLREEGKLAATTTIDELVDAGIATESPKGTVYSSDADVPLVSVDIASSASRTSQPAQPVAERSPSQATDLRDQEHLQLTLEETFFLSYALGSLEIHYKHTLLNNANLLRTFCAHSHFPVTESPSCIAPDDPFLLNYVGFHHFRSLGWVVRSGIKFACDYLLYLRGPAFHHAEFAVMILPAYSNAYWSEDAARAASCKKKSEKDWWWLHRVNRVQTQVHKTLIFVYVEVPPPWDLNGSAEDLDIGHVLEQYTVREVIWRRWSPNRNRD